MKAEKQKEDQIGQFPFATQEYIVEDFVMLVWSVPLLDSDASVPACLQLDSRCYAYDQDGSLLLIYFNISVVCVREQGIFII